MTKLSLASLALIALAACTLDREGGLDAPSGSGAASAGGSGTGIETGPGGSGGDPTVGGGGTGGTAPGVGGTGPGGGDVCPTGWTCVADPGPGTLVSRTDGAACPTGWSMPTPYYNDSDLPGCDNSCTCGAPQGGVCEVTVTRYDDSSCSTVEDGPAVVPLNQCQNVGVINASNQADSYDVPPPAVLPATCTGSGASAPPVDPVVTLCSPDVAPTPNGCQQGEVCVPEPESQSACVVLDGDVECPAVYSDARQLYATFVDNRVCECHCDPDQSGSCGEVTITLYNNAICGGFVASQTASNSCWDTSSHNSHDSYRLSGGAYSPGVCDVNETDSGEVTLTDLRTMCCTDTD